MKKLILVIVVLLSQYYIVEGQHLGIKGGPDILWVKYNSNGEPKNANPQMGFHLGMAFEFQLSSSLLLAQEQSFQRKDFRKITSFLEKTKPLFFIWIYRPYLFIKFRQELIICIFMPGLISEWDCLPILQEQVSRWKKGLGMSPQQYRKYDLGLDLGGGIAIDVWRFGLSCNVGLFDIRNADDISVKNRVLGIDVAYMFGH